MTGKAVIVSAPSGAGKTTLVRHLLGQNPRLSFSISACSRSARGEEVDGQDYYFLGVEGFKERIASDAFLEWEEVYPDQFYGTLREEIERIWAQGKHVIFDVDVVGGINLKKEIGTDALSIFIQPPSETELEKRLRFRNTETEEKIGMRLKKARQELAEATAFDCVIVNDILEKAQEEIIVVTSQFLKS